MVKNPLANAGDIRDWVPSPGRGLGKPVLYSCLENPMDRGDWQAALHGVAKSRIQLKQPSTRSGLGPITTNQPAFIS